MAKFPRRRAKNGAAQGKASKLSRFSRFARQPKGEVGGPAPARRRGIYLLPNAFTTAALFCGFYAIVMAMNQKFEHASWAIFIAMILDGLDGRVARLTNTQSEFGAQYDSLSDMVSFGAAPALVIYEWSLRGLGKLGWIAAFVYCAGASSRACPARLRPASSPALS
jgi:CDP-diacylglycerol--serine O-phosphatidyltransferase